MNNTPSLILTKDFEKATGLVYWRIRYLIEAGYVEVYREPKVSKKRVFIRTDSLNSVYKEKVDQYFNELAKCPRCSKK